MKKRAGSNAGRKPPIPSGSHAEIEAWIPRVMPDLQSIVGSLDRQIRQTIPGLEYAVKWRRAFYGLPGLGWLIEIVPYDVSVNLVFHGGGDFASPPPLGTPDRTRYAKVRTLEEAQSRELRGWIEQAGRVPGWT